MKAPAPGDSLLDVIAYWTERAVLAEQERDELRRRLHSMLAVEAQTRAADTLPDYQERP
jgi:hypothetical protein